MNTTRPIRAEDLMEGDTLPTGHVVTFVEWSIDPHGHETIHVATKDGTDVHAATYSARDIIEVAK